MRITARVKKVMDLQSGKSAKGEWKKQSVLVTQTENNFKDELLIDFWNDSINALEVGRNYDFDIIIKSREYNGKHYTNVNCKYVSPTVAETNDDNPF